MKLPADCTLQGWLGGSWNDALKQARLDAVPGGDVLVREYGPTIEAEEILAALRDCAADLNTIPTIHQYLVRARRPDIKGAPRPTTCIADTVHPRIRWLISRLCRRAGSSAATRS